jgi:large subunit ribosomal protein L23
MKDARNLIIRVHFSEKASNLMERENVITLIVDRRASKNDVKRVFEDLFQVKVEKVRTLITSRGEKKAYVKLAPGFNARDVATRLGVV